MLRYVLMALAGAALTLGASSPAAAYQQPDPADPLVVAENFLLARNARDPMGAVAYCSPLLAIQDSQGQWIADQTAAKHGASVERTTGGDTEAYGDLPAEALIPPPPPFRPKTGTG